MLYFFLIYLNILFLSYEFIIFNEEFFIAFTFFSFFFAAGSAVGPLIESFYNEDKIRVTQYLADDIFSDYSFFQNYIYSMHIYEYNKEFFYQYISFLGEGFITKFLYFYEEILLNQFLLVSEKFPEIFFSFSDKLISFISLKVKSCFLEFFNNKWNFLIFNDFIGAFYNFEESSLNEDLLENSTLI
jgi:hypothetical protein